MHRTRLGFLIVISSIALIGAAPANAEAPTFGWELHDTGSELSLTALDAVSAEVAWTASFFGIVLVTTDGGTTFTDVTPPDSTGVQDIEALSADVALVLAVPPEGFPHILRTKDSGATWTEVYRSTVSVPGCLAMIDNRHGFLVGDPVDGKFYVDVTSDGGRSWAPIDPAGMPDALADEFTLGFAGNCAAATGKKAFFGTGFAADGGRVFRSDDLGLTWQVSVTPDPCCIIALDFRTNRLGIAVGAETVSRTTDGGATWDVVEGAFVGFGDVAWWADKRGDTRASTTDAQKTVFKSGEVSSVSTDRGRTWEQFSDLSPYGIECVQGALACWASSDEGQIATLTVD